MDVLLIAVALLFIAIGVVGAVGLLLLEMLAKLEQMVQAWLRDERGAQRRSPSPRVGAGRSRHADGCSCGGLERRPPDRHHASENRPHSQASGVTNS
jgi:hypothetical protein